MAHAEGEPGPLELPRWKSVLCAVCAISLGILFLIAGTWKITDPLGASQRLVQALIPAMISLPAAIGLGIAETFAGVLLLVPRFRRWGAWLTGAMLVAFMLYVGILYGSLKGEMCSCFPWLERAVGPGFFIMDSAMLLLAFVAGLWARPTQSMRSAAIVFGAVTVFALVSYGVTAVRQGEIMAPREIAVEGRPFDLHKGRVFLYFFDPECGHCFFAARDMSGYAWKETRVIVVPTVRQQFAQEFLKSSGLGALITGDVEELRKVFSFGDPPYAVALQNGRQEAAFISFDDSEPRTTLAKLGYIE